MPQEKSQRIREAVLEQVFWSSASPVKPVALQFGLTPQAIQRHVRLMVDEGLLVSTGQRRHRRYKLSVRNEARREYPFGGGFSEDAVWQDFVGPAVSSIDPEAQDICHYGLTEMVNNAIDHAEGQRLVAQVRLTSGSIVLRVIDDGIGLFQKIASALSLSDPRQSLLELSKGKFTTDPKRHTGEGVFFTSRSFDRFSIRSADLLFLHSTRSDDWLVEAEEARFVGTRITMRLLLPSRRKLEEVFSRFSSGPDDYRFAKTHVPLKLTTFGNESLVSRSSAQRVLNRVERFDEVLLDFTDIRSIGQSFADEIFRVFANEFPAVKMIAINANEQVTLMIRRAEAARNDG